MIQETKHQNITQNERTHGAILEAKQITNFTVQNYNNIASKYSTNK